MSLVGSFYGSHIGRSAGSNERRSEIAVRLRETSSEDCDADHTQNGSPAVPINIRNAFIRQQQEVIPGLMEEIKASIGEPLKLLQGQVDRLQDELTKMKQEKSDHPISSNKKTRLPKVLTVCIFNFVAF